MKSNIFWGPEQLSLQNGPKDKYGRPVQYVTSGFYRARRRRRESRGKKAVQQ